MNMLFVMGPFERVAPHKDPTYALMREAERRGHALHFAEAKTLSLRGGTPWVLARPVSVLVPDAVHAWRGEARFVEVSSFPVVWLRTDPPFDEAYLEATWILEQVDRSRCLVLNDPVGVRAANEKLYALRFPELCPETLVTRDLDLLRAFVD